MATKTKKTRKQLKQKIRKLRQRLSELEEDKAERGQLEETIKQQETMLAVLNSIATVMMEASLDLDDVLQEIADGMVKAFGCNTALILLLDEREGVFKGSAVSTKGKLIEKINSIVGFPLAQIDFPAQADFNQAVANALDGRMTVRGDLYELVGPALNKAVCFTLQRLTGSKMFFSIPLLTKGKVVGGIFASTGEKLSEEDKETMMTFGNLAAYAIENVRLFGKGERRSTQLELISKVSEKVISILDLDILLQEVPRLIQKNFNYYNVSLFLLDRERNELVMEGVAGGFEHIAPGD